MCTHQPAADLRACRSKLIGSGGFSLVLACLLWPAVGGAAGAADKKQDRADKTDKAQEKSDKAREKLLKTIEAKLGKKEEGQFVVLFKTLRYEVAGPNVQPQVVPRPQVEVSTTDGRRAAAEAVFEFLANGQNAVQQHVMAERAVAGRRDGAGRRPLPPPAFNWQLIGRFDKEEDATKAADNARNRFNVAAPGGRL